MPNRHIGILIKMASLAFDRTASQLLLDHDLTPSQFKVLKYLSAHQDQLTRQIDLETFFKMSNPTVTVLLQHLEKKDMIERRPHPTDKRCNIIILSEKARLKADDYLQKSKDIERQFTQVLSAEEQATLKQLLLALIDSNPNTLHTKKGHHADQ
ncbi:MarR family winged helix-turn-helix transcriptional regulator [Streptococcus dysgalactiae]|uniref:MarR family winged helix-turn-helix transcriptional regulator n=1 Tax=Streptococcus dysgalactiae TaxID=1334 RepID=UPI003DA03F21